ncbi:MAG: hypothetical protein ACO1SV_26920 [Fimbriimonas sp.]
MLNSLLEQIKNAIFNDPSTPHRSGYDPSGLIGQIEGLFGQHQNQGQGPNGMNVRPASEDPLGDPADFGAAGQLPPNVRPASEDPLGDPGVSPGPVYNQGYNQAASYPYLEGQNIRPASEDPLGDPADQEGYRR